MIKKIKILKNINGYLKNNEFEILFKNEKPLQKQWQKALADGYIEIIAEEEEKKVKKDKKNNN